MTTSPAPRRRGRPAQGTPVLVRIPVDLLSQLDQHAEAEKVSRAEIVRRALRAYLSRP